MLCLENLEPGAFCLPRTDFIFCFLQNLDYSFPARAHETDSRVSHERKRAEQRALILLKRWQQKHLGCGGGCKVLHKLQMYTGEWIPGSGAQRQQAGLFTSTRLRGVPGSLARSLLPATIPWVLRWTFLLIIRCNLHIVKWTYLKCKWVLAIVYTWAIFSPIKIQSISITPESSRVPYNCRVLNVSLPNAHEETLIPSEMVSGGGAFGRVLGREGGGLVNGVHAHCCPRELFSV